jgi:8-oxo-dGTP pyrophosphatase MutT (NUDIX family)
MRRKFKMKEQISVRKAGGGLFTIKRRSFIYFANGKWDLPKGGIEKKMKILKKLQFVKLRK